MTKYTYKVIWSKRNREYVGLCNDFPSLRWHAKTEDEALKGIKNLVLRLLEEE